MNRSLQIKNRIKTLLIVLAAMHACIVLRAIYVEQVHGVMLRERQLTQSKRIIPLQARRGYIYDRNGKRLAMDVPYMSVFAVPSIIKNNHKYAVALSGTLHMKVEEIENILNGARKRQPYVWIKRFAPEEAAQKVNELRLNGIVAIREQKRVYPNETTAAPVIGFVGESGGIEGIEMTLDALLRGRNGYVLLEKDHLGRNIPQSIRETKPVYHGNNVYLTLDLTIQHYAEEELENTVKKFNARGGGALVLEPKTGKILAMASYPSYDPNHYKEYLKSDPTSFRNRVVWFRFEPGSIMKPLVVSTALDKGLIEPFKETIYCEPVFFVSGKPIKDDHGIGIPGFKNPVYVIAHSSNTGAAKIALMLGGKGIKSMVENFNFNKGFPLPLNGQQPSMLPDFNNIRDLTIANNGFGYGISVSMLHMAMATAAIANGGLIMKPMIVDKVVKSDGSPFHVAEPRALNRAITEESAKLLRYMMSMVVEEGTGKSAQIPGYTVAGKTGTAKIVRDGRYQNGEYFASFVGYAPVENPRLLVMVTIERPTPVYYAAAVAAPAFKEIMMKSLWRLNVPPSTTTDKPKPVAF
ncbi:MAG: penicillin-binding protein 2 [bacterium]